MSKCLRCNKNELDATGFCEDCLEKCSKDTVSISQEEYQKLRYKEMLFDAMQNSNEELN